MIRKINTSSLTTILTPFKHFRTSKEQNRVGSNNALRDTVSQRHLSYYLWARYTQHFQRHIHTAHPQTESPILCEMNCVARKFRP